MLNAKGSGNNLVDRLEEETEQDLYECPKCECEVPEDEFNHKRGCCYNCWWHLSD